MYYQLKSYLKFFLKSSNAHGIHSPFVYDLITKCFYDKKEFPAYITLHTYREALQKSSQKIEVTDYGAGSRVFKTNTRNVSEIAKYAGISRKRQELLFRICRYFKPEKVLEFGTSLGLATAAMALATKKTMVTTVEGCPNTAKVAKNYFEKFQLKNIQLKTIRFEEFFNSYPLKNFDFIYVDGNHSKTNTLNYFQELLKHCDDKTIIIFDDIYWSQEMTEAWQEIVKHPKVSVSIDTFYWGIVFFRQEQEKEHFVVRV